MVGPAGAPGQPGSPGQADPQSATLAGAVVQHRVIFLGPAGALVASCDQPATAGHVLGLALAAGVLGNQIRYSAAGVVADPAWDCKPGPILLGLDGALTQALPPSAAFVQQVAIALSPTSLRMGLHVPVMVDVPQGFAGATYRDMENGVEHLRAAAIAPGTPNAVVSTDAGGHLPTALLDPRAIGMLRLPGGRSSSTCRTGASRTASTPGR